MDHLSAANASDRARSASRRRWLVSSALVPACGIAALMVAGIARAETLPTGGSVAAGTASIATTGTTTTITQSSQNAVINWSSFSVAQGHAVVFDNATARGATLNRVTGTATSTIAGQITSNGSVYLINPNGIAITATGAVQTGGGFVASTLDIKDADFMAGKLAFAGNGASKSVTNGGRITAGKGAYVALLGGSVANSGTITVPLGKLAMGSGEQVALDLNGGNFMQVAVPTSLVTGSSALVDNAGDIVVMGGAVQLSAAVVKNAVRNVVNMSGSINADSAVGNGGTISLIGGANTGAMAGTVTVSGSLSARATGTTGNGGFVETSGEHVHLTGATVTTLAANGKAGTWLIDPVDYTVAATGGDQTGADLSTALAGNNVTIQSMQGATGTNGDININDAVSWSANTLTLDAYHSINVNAVMDATGTAGFAGIVGDNGTVSNGALLMGLGANGFTGTLNLAPTSSFSLNGTAYTIISDLGALGSITGTDLQGINGDPTGNYVLGANIDASATQVWNGGTGFTSLGTDGSGTVQNNFSGFTGAFNGLGHTITGLTINQPTANDTGLFGYTGAGSSVGNVGIVGGSISGAYLVGALVGYNAGGTITNAYATATVSGVGEVGGLVGYNDSGMITNAYAMGAVTSAMSHAGGLVGHNTSSNGTATITNAYATGTVSGGDFVGGLVGENQSGTITDAYATGAVAGQTNVGGLTGRSYFGATITNAHATGTVSGAYQVGGLVGGNYGTITTAYATGAITGNSFVGGLAGYNGGTITSGYATGTVTGDSQVGGLAGINYFGATITDSHATGVVTGSGSGNYVGGLLGSNTGAVTSAYASGTVSGGYNVGGLTGRNDGGTITQSHATGTVMGSGQYIGGLVGINIRGMIADAYATGTVSGGYYIGGLIGRNDFASTITNVHATGAVTGSGNFVGGLVGSSGGAITGAYATGPVSGKSNVGGLVGNSFGQITNVYATGTVTGSFSGSYIGGLVGYNGGAGTITNAYATGATSTGPSGSSVGGLVGGNYGTITSVYASGAVSGSGTYVGGLVGYNGALVSNAYWDSFSTGQSTGIGDGNGGGISAVTSDPLKSSVTNYAFNPTAYGNFSATDWVVQNGVRPMGVWEEAKAPIVNGVAIITNSHQLQLVNATAATLSASYVLGNDIDLSETGANMGTPATSAGMWSGAGFVSLGTDGAGDALYGNLGDSGFTGAFDGQGHTIAGLTINQPTTQYVGLFGYTGVGSSIANVGVVGINVSGAYFVGALVGENAGGTITNAYATGTVSGSYSKYGGLVGRNEGTISNAYFSGTVSGSGRYSGGLVGVNNGTIANAYATGAVSGNYSVGGLVGYNGGTITNAYATGSVTGSAGGNGGGGTVGGLVGSNNGTISDVYATGMVSGSYNVGGLAGVNGNTITSAYWDTFSTGQMIGVSVGDRNGMFEVTSDPSQKGDPRDAFNQQGYGFFNPGDWVFQNGARPMGVWEEAPVVNGVATITNSHQLQLINATADTLSAHYVLGGDIDLSETGANIGTPATSAGMWSRAGFVSLGTNGVGNSLRSSNGDGFTGAFDGMGHMIGGLTIQSGANVGLFGYTGRQSSISNVGIVGASVSGGFGVGALVGRGNGTITNAYATGAVNGVTYVGGLVGYSDNAITDAYATVAVTASGDYVGGLVGDSNANGTITSAYATGTVSGSFSVGGLVGANVGTVTNAYATGAVSGSVYVGGLVGNNASTITNAYATGSVSGAVTGGLVGYNGGTISAGYWDITTSGQTDGVGSGSASGVTGLTDEQMLDLDHFAQNYAGFDFQTIWSPPNQSGQNGDSPAFYPQLYALSNVIRVDGGSATAVYGAIVPSVPVAGIYGLHTGDVVTATPSLTSVKGVANVGTYGLTSSDLAYHSVDNRLYRVVATGNVTITPAPLTVTYTADAASSVYGTTPSGLTGRTTATGLVRGDMLNGTATWTTPASGTDNVGTYAINGSGLSASSNYTLTPAQAAGNGRALSITPAALTVTGNTTTTTYNGTTITNGFTHGILYGADTVTGVNGLATGTNASATPIADTLSGATGTGLSNYAISYVNGSLAINPAALTVTGNTTTTTYNGNAITNGFTHGILYGADTVTGVNGLATGTNASATPIADTLSGATGNGLSNYAISYVNGSLAINPAALTVTGNTTTATYNGTTITNGFTHGTLYGTDTVSGVNGLATGANASATPIADTLSGATGSGLSNYTIDYVNGSLSINPAALTVTGNTTTTTYNGNAITNGFTHGTLYGTDTVTGVNGLATGTNASATPIADTLSGATGNGLSNYTINYVNGSLAINPAALTVTYTATAMTSVYGNTPSGLSGTTSSTGLVNSDTLGGTSTWATSASGTSNVGTYAVTGAGLIASSNYTLTSVQAAGNTNALSITARPLTVTYTATALGSVYGNTPSGLSGTTSSTGLVNSDTLGGISTWATSANGTSNVGSYAVTGAGLTASSNYTLTSVQAAGNTNALSITARPLTVTYTATTMSSLYGNTPSGLTGSTNATGLVNGNTLAGTAVWTTGATGISDVGTYAVAGNGLTASSNYTVTSVQAVGNANALSITPAPLTVTYTAAAASSVYGNTPSGLTGSTSATGLVNRDVLVGTAAWSTSASGTSNVGTYAITGSGLTASSNYTLTSVQAAGNANALAITPAPLTVTYTAASASSAYGNTPSGLTGSTSATGLVNGNTLSGTAAWATSGSSTSNVGSYAVVGSGLVANANYTLTAVQAAGNATALSVTARPLTVTYAATPMGSIYGNTPSGLTGTTNATGLVNGNTLSGTAAWATSATGLSDVGTYAIAGSGLTANANYTLTAVQAAGNTTALSVTPRPITVTADAQTSIYGTAVPTLTYSVGGMGLVNGNTLNGALATSATATSNAGPYAIAQATLANSNYAVSYTGANLTIAPAALTLTYTANAASVLFGQPFPTLSGTVAGSGFIAGQTLANLSGTARWTTPATAATFAGSYAVNGGGLIGGNYAITTVQAPGNATALTINPSGQSITDFVSSISDVVPSISVTVQRQVSTLRQENEVVCAPPAIANTLRQGGSASLSGRCSR